MILITVEQAKIVVEAIKTNPQAYPVDVIIKALQILGNKWAAPRN